MKTSKWILIGLLFLSIFNGIIAGEQEIGEQAALKAEIERLENGLLPPVLIEGQQSWNLQRRMMMHRVPGVSIAVIKDFKVLWTRGYGYRDFPGRQPVTENTLFQMASVSKPVSAAAVLRLVQNGKLDLDKPVNNYLITWKLPENEWTGKKEVTIAHLLSHTSGITIPGYRGYSANGPVPTLAQLLDGNGPVNSSPVRVSEIPGKKMVYSGGGYVVIQQLILDSQNKTFPEFMKKTVFTPLGMKNSYFLQPLPENLKTDAASGHRSDAVPLDGKWHVYPELAPAGLWSTSADIAAFIADIQLAYKKNKGKLLSQKMAKKFLTPYISDSMGLGFFILEKNRSAYFHHSGGNEGFRAFVIAHRENGYGAVVLTNSDSGDRLYNEIIRGIALIYNWEHYLSKPYKPIQLESKLMEPFGGKYNVDSDHILEIKFFAGNLFARTTLEPRVKIVPIAENKFVRTDKDVVYEFVRDPKNRTVTHLIEHTAGKTVKRESKPADYTVPGELLIAGKLPEAIDAYKKLKKEKPGDPAVSGFQLLQVAYKMMQYGRLRECMGMLDMIADLSPQTLKSMHKTLETELKGLLEHPRIPAQIKDQIKTQYNEIMKKLGLPIVE